MYLTYKLNFQMIFQNQKHKKNITSTKCLGFKILTKNTARRKPCKGVVMENKYSNINLASPTAKKPNIHDKPKK